MAWPPTVPPTTRANNTPQLDTHPADHNQLSAAITQMAGFLPQGRIASAYSSSVASGITAAIDLAILPAITAIAGHRYFLFAKVHIQVLTTAGHVTLAIMEGATTLETITHTVTANGFAFVTCWVEIQPTAGAHTYKCQVGVTGGGTGTLQASGRVHGIYIAEVAGV